MALPAKINKRNSGGEGWGMGFFLVFFPQDHHHDFNSSSPFKSPTLLKRSNSSHILTRTQSTIYICALLIFLTLLLFTLSTFEPHNSFLAAHPNLHHYRRHLSQNHPAKPVKSPALQGLGTLYTRGTRAMNDLVLCHVAESTTVGEVKLFLRVFHRSGLAAKSDLVFVFPSIATPDSFDEVIREENGLFLRVIRRYDSELSKLSNGSHVLDFPASFDVAQLVKSGKRAAAEKGEPIWGRKIKSGFNADSGGAGGVDLSVLTRPSYGSVVGFGVGELDPENSLSGFLEHVPMSLRRWASYPMILGRLRRNFKHVMLVDVKEVLLLGDPLGGVRNRSPETVFLSPTPPSNRRKSSDKTHPKTFNPAVIMGGARGVRRLSASMLTEIVRTTTHPPHNKKGPVTESALLSRVAANDFLQKSIRLVTSGESIPEPSSLSGVAIANHTVVRRGNSNLDMEAVIMKHICSFSIDSSLYTDCQEPKA